MTNESRAAFETWAKPNRPRANILYHMTNGACLPGVDSWEYTVWQASREAALSSAIAACNELETSFSQAGARTESAVAGTCKYIIQELVK